MRTNSPIYKKLREMCGGYESPDWKVLRKQLNQIIDARYDVKAETLLGAFVWGNTPQGHDYWKALHNKAWPNEQMV